MNPSKSWVARYKGLGLFFALCAFILTMLFDGTFDLVSFLYVLVTAKFKPGLYAIEMQGELPDNLRQYCEDKNIAIRR
jgi:hypothetical protein